MSVFKFGKYLKKNLALEIKYEKNIWIIKIVKINFIDLILSIEFHKKIILIIINVINPNFDWYKNNREPKIINKK